MPRNYKPLFAILKKIGKDYKEAIYEFTEGRTESPKDLSDGELKEIIIQLNGLYPKDFKPKAGDQIRKKIIGIARQMRWVKPHPFKKGEWLPDIERIDNWCQVYGRFKKPFMQHTPEELSKIVTVFETKVYPDFLASLNK